MSKFKVGDKVIGNKRADYYWITNTGYIGEVTKVYECGLFEISGLYTVKEDYFDLVAPPEPARYEIHITCTDGKTTHAVKKVDGKITKAAKAVCCPADTYNANIGAQLAFNRLVYGTDYHPSEVALKPEPEKAEPEYLNMRVVCVAGSSGFTVGKVYEFKNGVVVDDDGDVRPSNGDQKITSLSDTYLRDWENKFIEFKGE